MYTFFAKIAHGFTKLSNTEKQFASSSQGIVWVCLTHNGCLTGSKICEFPINIVQMFKLIKILTGDNQVKYWYQCFSFILPKVIYHCLRRVLIWSFSSPYFSTLGLNKRICSVILLIKSECGNIRTKNTPNKDPSETVIYNLW